MAVTTPHLLTVSSDGEINCLVCNGELDEPCTRKMISPNRCDKLGKARGEVKIECDCSNKFRTAHCCDLHGRCIPNYKPKGKTLEKWKQRKPESKIYTLCEHCTDKPRS